MSLNFDLRDTKLRAENPGLKDLGELPEWPVVETLIMMTMVIGMGDWTEKNIKEIIARVRFVEMLSGPYLTSKGKGMAIPEPIIRSLVGLKTNVALEPRAHFVKRHTNVYFLEALRTA